MLMPNILQGFGLEIILIAEIGYLWFRSLKNRKTETLAAFFNLCSALMGFLLINIPVRITDLNLVTWNPTLVFVLNAIYILLETLAVYEWFIYFLTVQDVAFSKRKDVRIISFIPLGLAVILLVLSYKTHWMFYVDENGIYQRGSLFALQFLLPYTYLVASFVSAILAYKKSKNKRMLTIFLSAFLVSIGTSILQVFFSGSFNHAGLSFAVILVYMEMYQYEIKQIEISAANEKAANDAKNDFLSRMSHDIRTPLNGILGIIEINDRHPEDVELLAENRAKAKIAATHLVSLINDILDMSKLSSGKYEFSHEPFVMSRLVDDVITIAKTNAEKSEIKLINENADDTYVYPQTLGSPLHITRVLLNIIGNAIKYNKENGSVSLRLEHENIDDEHINYIFTISDTGIGMSEEYLKKLFEPFSQERIDARSVYNGSGLGMAITKALITQMGGTIDVESTPGEGSKFVVSLPFEIGIEDTTNNESENEQGNLKGIKILLVEDNELNIDIAQTLLEDCEAIVDVAENGQIALEKFSNNPQGTYDIILMDCMMPVMNGYDATGAIRMLERPDAKTIPIIAMTANAFNDDIKRCIDAGMDDHLPKPFEIGKVIKTVNKYVTGR